MASLLLIGAILGVFGFVGLGMLLAPDGPAPRADATRLACQIAEMPIDANGGAAVPSTFGITRNGRQGRSFLDMVGQSPRLSLVPNDGAAIIMDNVTEGRPNFTIALAPDLTFDITVRVDALRGAVLARGSGRCRMEASA